VSRNQRSKGYLRRLEQKELEATLGSREEWYTSGGDGGSISVVVVDIAVGTSLTIRAGRLITGMVVPK
jgi:hypothetical protein